jgi:hypothetical protein
MEHSIELRLVGISRKFSPRCFEMIVYLKNGSNQQKAKIINRRQLPYLSKCILWILIQDDFDCAEYLGTKVSHKTNWLTQLAGPIYKQAEKMGPDFP